MPDFSNFALGRKPHDAAALALAPQLRAHAGAWAPPPRSLGRDQFDLQVGLYRNDTLPTCTAGGLANAAAAQACLNGYQLATQEQPVVDFYAASIGVTDLTTLAATDGARELDVLAFQAREGFTIGQQVPLVFDFATHDPQDRGTLANVIARIGCGYWGVALANADKVMDVWDTDTPASAGDPTPGSWGLHCVDSWDYDGLGDTDLVTLLTWGMLQKATWRWVASRIQEAHAVICRQMVGAAKPFGGLAYADLKSANLEWAA